MLMVLISYRQSVYRSIFLIGVLLSMTCGCAMTVPSGEEGSANQTMTERDRTPAEEIWRQIATAVNRRTITRTTQLAQIVLVLVQNGELSEIDAKKFDEKFPNATSAERDLVDADAKTLGELK